MSQLCLISFWGRFGFWGFGGFFPDYEDHIGLIRDLQISHVDAVLYMALALGPSMDLLCSPQTWSPPHQKTGFSPGELVLPWGGT